MTILLESNIGTGDLPDQAFGLDCDALQAWERFQPPHYFQFDLQRRPVVCLGVRYVAYILPGDVYSSSYLAGWFDGQRSLCKETTCEPS